MQEKKQIHIQVKDKIATFVSMNFTLVGGNSDYEVVFDFDSDWSAYPTKTALFVYADNTRKVVFNGNICKGVPIENATICLIGVFADDIATTTPACIKDVRHSIRDVATSLPEPPTEDVYNQIMELLNRYINEASGIPSGGAKGQVLKKASDNDYDATWQDDEKGTQISEADILRVVKEYIEQNPPQDGFSPTVDIIPVDNGYTVNITDKNDVHSYTLYNGLNGISATHSWNGTILTVSSASGTSSADLKGEKGEKGERGEQGVQGLQGVQGIQGIQGVQGEKGDKGDGFSISKTYISVAAMNAGFYTDDVPLNGFVLINTGNVNDADNAKLFVKTLTGYSYLTDLSGSQGIKGDKGDKGDQGIQGEQGIRGEQGIQGIQGEKGEKGDKGDTGATGAAGQNGEDYVITDADYTQIAAIVLEMLGGEPIHGVVDENNHITLKGVDAGGKYTFSFVTEEGELIYGGEFVYDTNTYYEVTTPTLTHCRFDGSATAIKGQGYEATITAYDGYEISTLTATMEGGGTITADKATGKISTNNVTGKIVINAEAVAAGPAYTNLLPLSVDANNNDYKGDNGEDGYNTGKKMSGSTGNESPQSGACCSGFIELGDVYSTVRIKNVTLSSTAFVNNIVFYDSNKTRIMGYAGTANAFTALVTANDGVYSFKTGNWYTSDQAPAFFRFSCGVISDSTIVTINEEI